MLSMADHPAAQIEQAHIEETIGTIKEELNKLEAEIGIRADEERMVAVSFRGDQSQVLLNTMRAKLQVLHQLALSQKQPYFCRIDFAPLGKSRETYYIGRWGVMKTPAYETVVVDWRSPVANLYYSGQTGSVRYEAPDGCVDGEMTLKRVINVRDGQIESLFDSGIVSHDVYLQSVLGAVTTDRLKEIVTTIQAEQNYVIRYPLQNHLIVQGVAGSGKTTIALHRVAWLLYAYRDKLSPWQMMILAPNRLFINYISAVLPDLGVENVIQTTFEGLCEQWLRKQMPKLTHRNLLEKRLSTGISASAETVQKGSLCFKSALEEGLAVFEKSILPPGNVVFGPLTLFTYDQVHDIYYHQLRHFPLSARVRELIKYTKTRLREAADKMASVIQKAAEEKMAVLLNGLSDGPERRDRVAKLLSGRDARIAEVQERREHFIKEFESRFPDMRVTKVYRRLLEVMEGYPDTCAYLTKGTVYAEDLPALVVIMKKLYGIPYQSVSAVMIDEAQDLTPFQVLLIKQMESRPSLTLVGDMMQGIQEGGGAESWGHMNQEVFQGEAICHYLLQSYRSTVEITRFAGKIAAVFPVRDRPQANPIIRHGDAVVIEGCKTDSARIARAVVIVNQWLAKGYRSIALIEKTEKQAAVTYRRLQGLLPVRQVTGTQSEYRAGVMLISASQVKGLEFDCAMVLNASAEQYPYDAFTAKLLYVLCTRPLHCLTLLYIGTPSPLL